MGSGADVVLCPAIASLRMIESSSAVIFVFLPFEMCGLTRQAKRQYLPAASNAAKMSCHKTDLISQWAAFILLSPLCLLCTRALAFSCPHLNLWLGFAAVEYAYRGTVDIHLKYSHTAAKESCTAFLHC